MPKKWIITYKIPDKDTRGLSCYEIAPVDIDLDTDYEPAISQIWSKRDFNIGLYTDDELNPITEKQRKFSTDIANIEWTHYIVPEGRTKKLYQIAVFGRNFGEICLHIEPELVPFKMKRGDIILLQHEIIRPENEEDDDEDTDVTYKESPLYHFLYNFNTQQKNNSAGLITQEYDSYERDKVVVISIDTLDVINYSLKYLSVYSEKFKKHLGFMASETDAMFLSKENDRVLIQRYLDKNARKYAYKFLSNTTIDDIRTKFVEKCR